MRLIFFFLVSGLFLIQNAGICQWSPAVNAVNTPTTRIPDPWGTDKKVQGNNKNTRGENYFYGITMGGQLVHYQIVGGSILTVGVVDQNCPGFSLAICNNLNGNGFSPTFYTSAGTGQNSPYYYLGNMNWYALPANPLHYLYNAGGYGDYLYYMENNVSPPSYLLRYDGVILSTLYTMDTMHFTAADIAVDAGGNVWCFTGSSLSMSQFVDVVSPSGQLIKRYRFNFNTYSGFGCFMLDEVLYLAVEHDLYPLTFSGDSVQLGNPLPLPTDLSHDLASLITGEAVGMEALSKERPLSVYPNPATEYIEFDGQTGLLEIFDARGNSLISREIHKNTRISTAHLSRGLYFFRLTHNKEVFHGKILLQ